MALKTKASWAQRQSLKNRIICNNSASAIIWKNANKQKKTKKNSKYSLFSIEFSWFLCFFLKREKKTFFVYISSCFVVGPRALLDDFFCPFCSRVRVSACSRLYECVRFHLFLMSDTHSRTHIKLLPHATHVIEYTNHTHTSKSARKMRLSFAPILGLGVTVFRPIGVSFCVDKNELVSN